MKKSTLFIGVFGLALTVQAAEPAATAAPAGAPAASEGMVTPTVELLSSGVGTAVENRELIGEGTSFPAGTVAYLTKVKATSTPTTVKHIWTLDGKTSSEVTLNVNGSPWRTFSRKTVVPGAWKVELADESGNVIGSKEFTVTEDAQAPAPGGAMAPVGQ